MILPVKLCGFCSLFHAVDVFERTAQRRRRRTRIHFRIILKAHREHFFVLALALFELKTVLCTESVELVLRQSQERAVSAVRVKGYIRRLRKFAPCNIVRDEGRITDPAVVVKH